MQKRDSYLWFALLFSAVSHIVAFFQFMATFPTLGFPARWQLQFGLLVAGSLACAILQFTFYRRDVAQAVLVLLRLLFLFVATYPLGNALNVRATLVASFVLEAMIYYPVPWALLPSLSLVAASVLLHSGVSIWNARSAGASLDTLLFLGFYPLAVMLLGLLLKNAQRLAAERKRLIEQLRQASTSLVETNILLQEHVVRGEEQAKLLERERISRELHDTVGYALMNIIVTMKASMELSRSDGERMREFMSKGIEQAQKGLADTRSALRELRSVTAQPLSLISSVDRLAGAFKDTHIAVTAHYSNMPWSFTEEIDATIYRIVQEGITNAIRHGNATRIDINLSLDGARIGVAVLDNGSGTAEITEGIGMAGIRERVTQIGGGLSAGNSAGGFLLSAWLPFGGGAVSAKIRLVIADDQSLITQSFKVLLETAARDLVVVGTARDGREALDLAVREKPDVVLLDVRMPGMDGVQAAEAIHRALPAVRIIMLTTFDDDAYVQEAIRSGAVGYLLKDISTEELISSIRAVHHGAVLVSSTVAQKLFQKAPEPAPARDADLQAILGELSRREVDILRLLARGYENKEIAEKLFAAEQTIKNSVSTLYAKLGVENRREARRFALRCGIVQPNDISGGVSP